MSTPANASGAASTVAVAAGLKGLGAMGLFVTGFVATVSLIVQNVGALPQAAIATQPTVSSTSAVKLPGQAQVLGAEPFGTSQVMVRMPAFTTPGAADRLGQTYGMELVGSYPAFGRYLFNLPQIRVEPADTSSRAFIFFPPRTSAGEVNAYLATNQLKVVRWYRARDLAGETPDRTALVTLPRITPVMVDGVRGIWQAIIPMHIDSTRLSSWATASGIHVISYDPSTGALLIKGPAIAPKPIVTRPPVRRVVPPVVIPPVVTPPAPQPLTTPKLFVTFAPNTTVDVARAAIEQAGAQTVSFDATTAVAVVSVTNGNTTAVTTLLSAATSVKCVNTSATTACNAPAPAPVVVPTITPISAPVALRILPDTSSLNGTIVLSADVQTGDGSGSAAWTLSGALANTTLGGASVTPIAGNQLAWTSTVNFDSTTVPDGAYTLSIRIQDGLGNVTVVNRSVTVSNAKPAQPAGFAAAAVPAGVALTWQQPAVADAALYRISRDGVQLAELPASSTSYVDTTAAAGSHTYQLVLVNRFGSASEPVTIVLTVAPAAVANSITMQVLLPGGEQLAADGLAGGHLILSASALQASTSLSFQYSVDGASWSSVPAAVACSTSCTADWNLAGLAPGHYRVRATGDQLVSDEAGFIIAETPALPAPTALVATATTWGVDLHWIPPAGLIPPAYLISRQTATGWSSLAQSSTLDYTDTSTVAGQSYAYRVQAISSDGTAGTPSDSASISLSGAATNANPSASGPAAPTGLHVVDGPGGATLLWQPVPGVTRYVVERALDSAGTFQPLPAVATLMFRDAAQRVGGQVYYRVRSVGPSGVGDPSAVVAGLVLPGPASTTPAPFVVAAASGQSPASTGSVELGASQAPPVRAGNSVVIHAGGSAAGVDRADVQKLAGTSWLTLLTLTTTVTPGGWSAASSVDLSGVGAGDLQLRAVAKSAGGDTLAITAPATVQVVHSAPMPTALRATSSGTAVSLSWTAPASSAPLTYSVYRAAGAGGYSLAASGLSAPAFDDHFLAGKVAVSYVVTATDDLGNQSAWSAPASLVTPATWSQAAPTLQFVQPSSATLGDTVLLQAAAGSASGIGSFTFAYSPQGSSVWINLPDRFPLAIGGPTLAGLNGLAAWGALFRTPGMEAGTYTVRATATDMLGHSADAVRTLMVAASQSRGPPAPNFTLNATASVGAVHLSWNVAGATYQVERSTDGAAGPFKAIGTTTSNTFDDRLLIPGFAYAYRVIALGAGSITSSTITATPLATPANGTTSSDQQVNVILPAASADGLNVSVATVVLTPSMSAGMQAFGAAYQINATSLGSWAQVHLLDQAATLTFTLPAGISAAQASELKVYHWDDALGVWRVEPSTLDLATGRITATVSHFSTFAVGAALTASADLALTMTGPASANAGTNVTYVITLTNNGPDDAVTLNLPLLAPANTLFVSFRLTSGPALTGTLAALATQTFNYVLRISAATPGGTVVVNTVTVSAATPDPDLSNNSATVSTTVGANSPITTTAVAVSATEGAVFSGTLITFADADANGDPTKFTATINWGDFTATPGIVSATPLGFAVDGSHTYIEEGSFQVTVAIHDVDGSTVVGGTTATVADAALSADGGTISAAQGVSFSGMVAGFTDGDPNPTLNDFTATIDWGDATSSPGILVQLGPNTFEVDGTHTYLTAGTFTYTVDVLDVGGATAQATGTANVQAATADVSIVKTGPVTAVAGTDVTYSITVTNNGPSPAENVIISDTAPSHTTLVSLTQDSGPSVGTTLPAGGTMTFTLVVTVAADTADGTVLINTASTSSTTADPDNTNNSSTFITTVINRADLAIFKTGPASAVAGTDVSYSITVTNNGPLAAANVIMSDIPPSHTTLVSFTQDSGPSVGTTLPAGGTMTFTLVVTVAADTANGTVLINTANVSSTTADPDDTNNSSTVITTVITRADLMVVKTGPAMAFAGDNIPYSITVTNTGPSAAKNVFLRDTLPLHAVLVTGSFIQTSGPTNGGTLPAGGTMTFTLLVTVPLATPDGTVLVNTAIVDSPTFDPNRANNASSVSTTVVNRADLMIVKTGPATIKAGDNITYAITVTNKGPSAATSVDVSDFLPAGTTLVSFVQDTEPSAGSTLPAGGTMTFTLIVMVAASTPDGTVITNTASVSSPTFDPDHANNSSTVSTTVLGQADLAITMSGPDTAVEGVSTDYSLTLTNNGPGPATNVTFGAVGSVPSGANLVSAIASSTTLGVTCVDFTCAAASLASGSSVSMILSLLFSLVTPNVSGSSTVFVSGQSPTLDPNLANNTTSQLINVIPRIAATGTPVSAVEGATFSGQVATFTTGDPRAVASDFTATINWGDGTPTSVGTIVGAAGVFAVSGSHAYAEEGSYTISVVVTAGGQTALAGSTATVVDAPLAATGVDVAATEGAAFTGAVASVTDANPNGTAAEFTATINWGDTSSSAGTVVANGTGGFTVTGVHTYTEEGSYAISVAITDAGGSSATAYSTATVADAALTATGVNVAATEGASFTGVVATFTDANPNGTEAEFSALINWGDTLSSAGTVVANGAGGFSVTGVHTYAEEGSYAISVAITDAGGSSATANSTATVADAALAATGVDVAATEGASFTGAVATFTDANPNGTADEFTALINWGDTSSSGGTVVANGTGSFTVNGTHTYAEEGSYPVSVTITDAGSAATASSNAAVADANLQASGLSLPATRFTAFSGVVATFADADPAGVPSDYVATINWGDGTTSIGNVLAAGGAFAVSASHVFGEGRFTITTTIVDAGGATAVATSTITVDLTAPVTTATVDGTLGRNGWWTAFEGPGVLTLFASDNVTGVVVTYYTINGGVPQVYTCPISLDEGRYVIRFWSIDGVGNVEAAQTIRIKVRDGHVEEDRDDGDGGRDDGNHGRNGCG